MYVVIARSRISSSHADTHSRAALGRSLLSLPSSINHSSIIVASIRPSAIATHTRYGTHITSSAHQSCSSSRSSPLALCRVTQPSSHPHAPRGHAARGPPPGAAWRARERGPTHGHLSVVANGVVDRAALRPSTIDALRGHSRAAATFDKALARGAHSLQYDGLGRCADMSMRILVRVRDRFPRLVHHSVVRLRSRRAPDSTRFDGEGVARGSKKDDGHSRRGCV